VARLLSALMLAASLLAVDQAAAAEPATFAFIGSRQTTCWESTEGINPTSLVVTGLPGGVTQTDARFVRQVSTSEGVELLLGLDGTLTSKSEGTRVFSNGIFRSEKDTCTGSFVFDGATNTILVTETCNASQIAPSTAFAAVEANVKTRYRVIFAGDIFVLSSDGPFPPTVERVTVTLPAPNPAVPPTEFQYDRVCTRTGILTFQP
jgi:hypothetical protein